MKVRKCFGKPSQVMIIVAWTILMATLVFLRLNVRWFGSLFPIMTPEYIDGELTRILSLSLIGVTAMCLELYALFTFMDMKRFLIRLWNGRIGRLFIASTVFALCAGLLVDLVNMLFSLDNQYANGFIASLYFNFCLYLLFAALFRRCSIRFSKGEILITAVCVAVVASLLIYSCVTRRFLYYWDYVSYYKSSFECFEAFRVNSLYGYANVWWSSNWDKSWFINLFTMFFMRLTPMTQDAYIASLSFSVLMPLVIIISAFVIRMMDIYGITGRKRLAVLAIALTTVACQPQLYFSLYRAMPDMFCLVFAIMLAICLVGYDFGQKDVRRWFFMLVATILAVYSRRWMAFYMVAFWGAYGLLLAVKFIKTRNWKAFLNLVFFAVVSVLVTIVFLFPMVLRVMGKNYGADYSSWKTDTLGQNIITYFRHCGYLVVAAAACSYVLVLARRRQTTLELAWLICSILPLCLFHVIQSADYHQLLILAPSMVIGTSLLPVMIFSLAPALLSTIISVALVILFGVNITNAYTGHQIGLPWLTDTSLLIADRPDYEMVDVVNEWIVENSGGRYGTVYMIPHNTVYCPDVFRYKGFPHNPVYDLLPYGSDVVSAHKFPIELFTGSFVMTADPLGQGGDSMAPRINEVFLQLCDEGYFELEESFEMNNGYVIEAYRRAKAVDQREIDLYISRFSDLIEQFPENYEALTKFTVGMEHSILPGYATQEG